eukprot:249165-Prorocentrum_minimum.AAC.1
MKPHHSGVAWLREAGVEGHARARRPRGGRPQGFAREKPRPAPPPPQHQEGLPAVEQVTHPLGLDAVVRPLLTPFATGEFDSQQEKAPVKISADEAW